MRAVGEHEHVKDKHTIECKIQWCTICMLAISLLGIIGFVILLLGN